jgi:hypothetical protein
VIKKDDLKYRHLGLARASSQCPTGKSRTLLPNEFHHTACSIRVINQTQQDGACLCHARRHITELNCLSILPSSLQHTSSLKHISIAAVCHLTGPRKTHARAGLDAACVCAFVRACVQVGAQFVISQGPKKHMLTRRWEHVSSSSTLSSATPTTSDTHSLHRAPSLGSLSRTSYGNGEAGTSSSKNGKKQSASTSSSARRAQSHPQSQPGINAAGSMSRSPPISKENLDRIAVEMQKSLTVRDRT